MKDLYILKLASYTYSPTAAESRNYTPKKPKIKPGVVKINGSEERKVSAVKFPKTDVPRHTSNKSTDPDIAMAPFRRFSNDFKNCISGTGYGRRYWVESPARNAYSLS